MPQLTLRAECARSLTTGSAFVPNQDIAGSFYAPFDLCVTPSDDIFNAGPDCSAENSGSTLGFNTWSVGSLPSGSTVTRYRFYFTQSAQQGGGDPVYTDWNYTDFPNWQVNLGGQYNVTPNSGSWLNSTGEYAYYNCCIDSWQHGFVSGLNNPDFWNDTSKRIIILNVPATCTQLLTAPQSICDAAISPGPTDGCGIFVVLDYNDSPSGSQTVYKRRYSISLIKP